MLKKLNNNKGVDITLIGTSWILVLVVCICAILDMFIITHSKETVISYAKSAEIFSLAKNFDMDTAFNKQQVNISIADAEAIKKTFVSTYNKYAATKNNDMIKMQPINIGNSTVYVIDDSIYLSAKGLKVDVKTFIKNPSKIPFFGGTTDPYKTNQITSSITTKIIFYSKRS